MLQIHEQIEDYATSVQNAEILYYPSLEGWGGCVVRHMEFHVKTEKKLFRLTYF